MKKIISKIFLLLLLLLFSFDLISQEEEEIKSKLPLIQGIANAGTEFVFTIPPVYEETAGNNYIKIFITCAIQTKVQVEIKKYNKIMNGLTIANDVIGFDLKPTEAQPFLYNPNNMKGKPAQIWDQAGVRITSDDPIVVYVMCKYRFTSDGFLALPVPNLGKEYIVATYNDMGWNGNQFFPPWAGITAAYDNTDFNVTMGGNASSEILTDIGQKIKPGQKIPQFRLQKGDVYMFSSNGPFQDITGSKIVANKPFSLVSGHFCTNIPLNNQWCDYTVEMQLPTEIWGKTYHIPAYTPRRFNGIVRVFAKEESTNVYRDGQFWFNLPKGGGIEGVGWQEQRVWGRTDDLGKDVRPKNAVITADKPIGITYYNPGTQEDADIINQADSDPYVMTMYPVEQYENEITFCTPAVKGGDRFGRNYINVVFELGTSNKIPNDLEFAEVKSGSFVWKSFNSIFGDTCNVFFGDVNGKRYGSRQVLLAGDGVYKLRSPNKLASFSYGFNDYESYGYPTAGDRKNLAIPDIISPEPLWSQEKNGNISNGLVTDKPDDPALRSNLSIVRMDNPNSYNYKFEFNPIISGESITTSWKLTLIDSKKDGKADLIFIDRSGNDTTITITYKAVVIDNVPLVLDIENELCPNTIVKYELTDKDFYSFNWKFTGKYELIDSIKNAVTIKWTEPGLGKIIVNRKNSIYDTTETLNLNLSIKPNPVLDFNFNKSYCNQDTISLDFTSNVGLKEYNFVVMKEDNFINYKLVNKSQNQLKIIISEQGKYFIKVFATSDIGCVDSTTLTFEVLDIPLKPELTYDKNVLSSSVTNSNEYIWYIDGEYFTTTKTNKIVPFKEGLYTCLYIDNLGCKSELSEEYNVTFTSVENDTNLILVNSSSTLITLEITNDISINNPNIVLLNILGNIVNTQVNITGTQIEIKPANKLSAGTYFIQINNSNGSIINNTIKIQIN